MLLLKAFTLRQIRNRIKSALFFHQRHVGTLPVCNATVQALNVLETLSIQLLDLSLIHI